MDPRPNFYPIRGGIGKCVAFTALIEKLAKRDGKKIAVGCGFPGIVRLNPNVSLAIEGIGPEPIKIHIEELDNIIMREPYISNHIKGDRHILDEWASLYDLPPFEKGGFYARPELFIPEPILKETNVLNEKIKNKFFLVQWTGGQPPKSFKKRDKYPVNYLTKGRNVKNYQEIMSALAEAFPDHLFVIYALPNEPVQMPEHLKSRVARLKAPALAYAALLKYADGFIALDSSLQHFAAATQIDKPGVVLWGATTTPAQIGYAFHKNLLSSESAEVVVSPNIVIDALNSMNQGSDKSKKK